MLSAIRYSDLLLHLIPFQDTSRMPKDNNYNYLKEVDKSIGSKIYSLRLAKGLSRKQLAASVNVSHQQLQKYEKGTNRISIGRLLLISKALNKNISYFYEALETANNQELVTQHQRMCIEVSRNFMKLKNPTHQEAIHTLIKSLI